MVFKDKTSALNFVLLINLSRYIFYLKVQAYATASAMPFLTILMVFLGNRHEKFQNSFSLKISDVIWKKNLHWLFSHKFKSDIVKDRRRKTSGYTVLEDLITYIFFQKRFHRFEFQKTAICRIFTARAYRASSLKNFEIDAKAF